MELNPDRRTQVIRMTIFVDNPETEQVLLGAMKERAKVGEDKNGKLTFN